MRSIKQQIELLEGLLGTKDANDWEQGFIRSVAEKKADTTALSDKQVEIIDDLHSKHFA